MSLWLPEGRVGEVTSSEFGMDMDTLLYFKWIINNDLLYSTWDSAQYYVAAWMGRGVGGEWTRVDVWLSPLTVHLKLSQHCFLDMKVKVKSLSRVWLFVAPWTVTYQSPPSMGFSWHEYGSGLPFPSPGDLRDPGIKPGSPAFQADALTSERPGKPIQNKKLK